MTNPFGALTTKDEALRGGGPPCLAPQAGAADVLIPLIRAAATISIAIAPCALGFVIIAVAEQLSRSIMVGDDPESLVSDLQSHFPDSAIEVDESGDAGLGARVVELIEYMHQVLKLPLYSACIKSFITSSKCDG